MPLFTSRNEDFDLPWRTLKDKLSELYDLLLRDRPQIVRPTLSNVHDKVEKNGERSKEAATKNDLPPLETLLDSELQGLWRSFTKAVELLEHEHKAFMRVILNDDASSFSFLREADYKTCATVGPLKSSYDIYYARGGRDALGSASDAKVIDVEQHAARASRYVENASGFHVRRCKGIAVPEVDFRRMLQGSYMGFVPPGAKDSYASQGSEFHRLLAHEGVTANALRNVGHDEQAYGKRHVGGGELGPLPALVRVAADSVGLGPSEDERLLLQSISPEEEAGLEGGSDVSPALHD